MVTATLNSCIVVGAGLSGLLAARRLQKAGVPTLILEAAEYVGGRLATTTLSLPQGGAAWFDHGAQFFTVRDERFRALVAAWHAAGIVRQWSDGFATPDGTTYRDGYPRYRGHPHMAAIARHLASNLDVQTGMTVSSIRFDNGWLVACVSGATLACDALILTPPVPQSLALLDRRTVTLPEPIQRTLSSFEYEPCLALLLALDGKPAIPEPGGMWPAGPRIAWLADNQRKGISPTPAVTIHGSTEFSNAYFHAPEEEIVELLLEEAAPWLGQDVLAHKLVRWPHSIPRQIYPQPFYLCRAPGLLAFAGDAFAGPRVEGAALSGLAAAEAVLAAVRDQ